jgi:hypothetical protein
MLRELHALARSVMQLDKDEMHARLKPSAIGKK